MILPFVLGACVHWGISEDEQMLRLGSALTKLSAAVENSVRYKNPPPDLSDAELLALATQHDPALLDPFRDYAVRVLRQDRHAIVLVCTQDRQRGLLEDAGCTGKLDKQSWKENPPQPCEFGLAIPTVCSGP